MKLDKVYKVRPTMRKKRGRGPAESEWWEGCGSAEHGASRVINLERNQTLRPTMKMKRGRECGARSSEGGRV